MSRSFMRIVEGGKDPERKKIMGFLHLLILLAPLPFGCVGGVWRPLFFVLLCLWTVMAWNQVERTARKEMPRRRDPARDLLYGPALRPRIRPYGPLAWARRLVFGFCLFCLIQVIPLPAALVRIVSPRTMEIVATLRDSEPAWQTLSLVPHETVTFLLEVLVWIGFALAWLRLRPGWREMTATIRVLGLSAAFQVFVGLVRMLLGTRNFFLFFYPVDSAKMTGELTGTLFNANHFAFFLEMVIPLLLGIVAVDLAGRSGNLIQRLVEVIEKKPHALMVMASLVLAGMGVVLSNSRAGLTALLLGITTAALLVLRTRRAALKKVLPWIAGILVLFAVAVAGAGTWRHFQRLEQKTPERIGRLVRWANVSRLVEEFPLWGTGMGTFRYAYFLHDRENNQWVTHAHNDLLETVSDGGALGALLLLGALVGFGAGVVMRWRKRERLRVRLLGAGGIAALAAALFHSLFDFSLRIPFNVMILTLIMAMTLRVVMYRRQPESKSRNAARRGGEG